jgi:DNA-binding CsgD family transcriptional regulator
MTPRPWTHKDIAILRSLYHHKSRPEIGELLNRTPGAVGRKAVKLGLARVHFRMTPAALQTLRTLTEAGYSETDIAEQLGTNWNTVRTYRRKLGLASQPRSAHYRAKVRALTRQQCKSEGVRSLVELRYMRAAAENARRGWPTDISPNGIKILEALLRESPLPTVEIARRIGGGLCSQALKALRDQKLIVKCGRHYAGRPGCTYDVYRLVTARDGVPLPKRLTQLRAVGFFAEARS